MKNTKNRIQFFFLISLTFLSINAIADNKKSRDPETISSSTLQKFNSNPEKVKAVINHALTLAGKNIRYQYGSADPKHGGMDCSGTIYYLLTLMKLKDIPRSSLAQHQWVKKKGTFYPVNSNSINSSEFSNLKPGDLLFWSGTYASTIQPDVTHVMLYLGKNKDGAPLMAGASDGRTYKGRSIYGMSVFDFILPSHGSKSRFLGYSCIPEINCLNRKMR